jgi:prevent-host-death family protein
VISGAVYEIAAARSGLAMCNVLYTTWMYVTYPIAEARTKLGELARRAAQREHIVLTDHGVATAVLISPAELEDLEDALALARLERDRALGLTQAPIPHSEARRALLEAAGRAD